MYASNTEISPLAPLRNAILTRLSVEFLYPSFRPYNAVSLSCHPKYALALSLYLQ